MTLFQLVGIKREDNAFDLSVLFRGDDVLMLLSAGQGIIFLIETEC